MLLQNKHLLIPTVLVIVGVVASSQTTAPHDESNRNLIRTFDPKTIIHKHPSDEQPSCFRPNTNVNYLSEAPLPKPIVNLGFPKAGTTTMLNFFRCGGLRSSHNIFFENDNRRGTKYFFATCIRRALQDNNPPLKTCGDFDVYTQIEMTFTPTNPEVCYWPQTDYDALLAIHEENPYATFVLNFRDIDTWVTSLRHWVPASFPDWPMFDKRMARCGLTKGLSDEDFREFFCEQVERVRRFVAEHPTHALVEFDIEDENAGALFSEAFQIDEECWGHGNTGRYHGNKKKEEKKKSVAKKSVVKKSVVKKDERNLSCFQANPNRDFLSSAPLPKPVINLGFPKAGTTTMLDFFRCGKVRSSHNVFYEDDNKRKQKYYCAVCMKDALAAGQPILKTCGDFDAFTQIELTHTPTNPDFCYWPQTQDAILEAIHRESPRATFVLNFRDVDSWINSLRHWSPGKYPDWPTMDKRMAQCGLTKSLSDDDFKAFYCEQVQRVRDFVKKYPTHTLIEFDIGDETVGEMFSKAFGIGEKCWRHSNKGKYTNIK